MGVRAGRRVLAKDRNEEKEGLKKGAHRDGGGGGLEPVRGLSAPVH